MKCRDGLGSDFAAHLGTTVGVSADPAVYDLAVVISDCDAARVAIVADDPESDLAKAISCCAR